MLELIENTIINSKEIVPKNKINEEVRPDIILPADTHGVSRKTYEPLRLSLYLKVKLETEFFHKCKDVRE